MKIAVAKENELGEFRVAQVPDTVSRLVKQGFEVWVEAGTTLINFPNPLNEPQITQKLA